MPLKSSLQTIIVEVEAMLNDHPLTYISSDISDPEPLTPAHLLYGRRILQPFLTQWWKKTKLFILLTEMIQT